MGIQRRSVAAKRTIKYLEVCSDKKAASAVLSHAPDSVVKLLSDISLNALKNPTVRVSRERRRLFRKHRAAIAKLVDPTVSIDAKRKTLQQGGFAWIPAIIGTVLGALGTSIFGGNKS
jgi:hypothetical protein